MYVTALRHAEMCLRRFGRKTINGKDAHDFAIDSLRTVPWKSKRIWFDMLDAFRAEARRQKRFGSQIPFEDALERHGTRGEDSSHADWFSAYWFLTDRQREIALLMSAGWSMSKIGKWLGISENAMSMHGKRIRKRIYENMPFKSQNQRNWMYANEPEMAERWEKKTPKNQPLPKKSDEKKKWKRK